MKTIKTRRLITAGLFAALTLGAWSAAPGGQQAEPQLRARLRERINHLYLLRLTRALDLTEEQAAQLYPLLIRTEKEKAELQSQMGLDLGRLREELAKTSPSDEEILRLSGRVSRARRAIRQKDEEVEAALEGTLTPIQRGRYLLFTVEFLRSVGENLGGVRGGRSPLKRSP
jgi:Spy/CpxP family protein refolding chaperone